MTDWNLPTIVQYTLTELLDMLLQLTPREQVDLVARVYSGFSNEQKLEFERLRYERARD